MAVKCGVYYEHGKDPPEHKPTFYSYHEFKEMSSIIHIKSK
jgi:hypothetical protein